MSLKFCGYRIVLSALILIARQALFFLKEFVSLSLEQDSFYFSVGEKKFVSMSLSFALYYYYYYYYYYYLLIFFVNTSISLELILVAFCRPCLI